MTLPYNAFGAHLRERFGCRVHRVALDGGFTCPNLDGTRGRGGCFFCDASGSLAGYGRPDLPLPEQLRQGIERLGPRTGARKFLAYFQSFTATHASPQRLRALMDQALTADERVIGLALGARPDCLGEEMLDLLAEFAARTYLWLDVGLESINNETLARINRLCSAEEFAESMRRVKARGLRVCAHLIFGLPGDSPADMLGAIDCVNDLGLDGVKIHNLYIDSHSSYGSMWKRGQIEMMEKEQYVDLVCRALGRLAPEVLVHRLTGEAPRDRHLAPAWALNKNDLIESIRREMARRGWTQGILLGKGPQEDDIGAQQACRGAKP